MFVALVVLLSLIGLSGLLWVARRRAPRRRGETGRLAPASPSMRETLERRVREGNAPL